MNNGFSKSALAALMLAALTPALAHAAPAPQGLAIGLERTFGLDVARTTAEAGNTTTTSTETGFGLGLDQGLTPFSLTRLGIDYILDNGLTLGGGIGVVSTSQSTSTKRGGTETTVDGATVTSFVISPRVGYLAMFTPTVGLWPRGGLSYGHQSVDGGDGSNFESSTGDTALTLEAPLVILPLPGLAFLVAPTLDAGLSHSAELNGEKSNADVSTLQFGIQFGIIGIF